MKNKQKKKTGLLMTLLGKLLDSSLTILCLTLMKEHMSRVMRKPTFWFPTWSNTIQAVQLQKMARGLKFRIRKVEGLFYQCSENKGAQLRGYFAAHMTNEPHRDKCCLCFYRSIVSPNFDQSDYYCPHKIYEL